MLLFQPNGSHLIMALRERIRSSEEWKTFFTNAEIPEAQAAAYSQIFAGARLTETTMSDVDKATLQELEITVLGDQLAILRHIKASSTTPAATPTTPTATVATAINQHTRKAAITAKVPTLHADMTQPQFRKFKVDWKVYKQITQL